MKHRFNPRNETVFSRSVLCRSANARPAYPIRPANALLLPPAPLRCRCMTRCGDAVRCGAGRGAGARCGAGAVRGAVPGSGAGTMRRFPASRRLRRRFRRSNLRNAETLRSNRDRAVSWSDSPVTRELSRTVGIPGRGPAVPLRAPRRTRYGPWCTRCGPVAHATRYASGLYIECEISLEVWRKRSGGTRESSRRGWPPNAGAWSASWRRSGRRPACPRRRSPR